MRTLARCIKSILIATLFAGCAGTDSLAPSTSDIDANGARIAQSSGLTNGGTLDTLTVSTALNASLSASSSVSTTDSKTAILTIFADPTTNGPGSSGGGTAVFGTHAFITVKNVSTSSITVGLLTGIQPGKTVSLGTWGNMTEHSGLWYNLEAYFVSKNGWYSGRVSTSWLMSSSQLSTLTSFIKSNDSWSLTSNCSAFAVAAWNKVVDSYARLNAGVPNTPKVLANNIKVGTYQTRATVPYDYVVYRANGSGTPQKSTVYK